MTRILLAEDDHRLATLVKDYLQENGFDVTVEADGDLVEQRVHEGEPDLVILDIMLPNRDGLSICRALRPTYTGPILMLTARNEDADQILGLEFGADDYVIKPAEPRVLQARIRALLRRAEPRPLNPHQQQCLRFNELSIDAASRSATLRGQTVKLSTYEFELLWLFAQNAGEILTRDFLFQELHGRIYDGLDRTVDVHLSQLRRKLGDNTDAPEGIKTVWGRGYVFIADAWKKV